MKYRVITDGIHFTAQVEYMTNIGLSFWKDLEKFPTELQAVNCVKADRAKRSPPIRVCSYWDDIEGEFQSYL